jgi:hypothetical protein
VIRLPASALIGGEELPVAVNPGAKFAIIGTAVDIYAALNSDAAGSAAKILKNGEVLHTLNPVSTVLGAETQVLALALSGNDVYAAGYENSGGKTGRLWKNGALVFASSITESEFQALAISGSDVYVAGYEEKDSKQESKVWKNGAELYSFTSSVSVIIGGIAVGGSDVYAAVYEKSGSENYVAKVKKNDAPLFDSLTDGSFDAYCSGIAVGGTDVYVVGGYEDSNKPSYVWKNGAVLHTLTGSSGIELWALAVSGSGVYAGGAMDGDAVVWKNGDVLYRLTTGADEAGVEQIVILEDTVYAAGFADTGSGAVAKIWKNNEVIYTAPAGSGETWISGLAVKARN